MKTKITLTITLLFCLLIHANNISVSNISLENLNESNNWVQVEFDLSWENSWRLSAGPSNWDAAWVFVKYRVNNEEWIHARLAQTDFIAPSGSIVDVSSDGVGAFVYRDKDGSGNLNLQDIRLRWNYGTINTSDVLEIQVFAIEMVYIPEGSFYVGGTSGDEVNKFYEGSITSTSYQITSEDAINIGISRNDFNYVSDNDFAGDGLGPIPAGFPKGFNSFYIMKYELSESQWLSFFNSLTVTQKVNRDITDSLGKNTDDDFRGNTISWEFENATAFSLAPDRAMAYTNAGDALAYLDWCGLRPFTELEFEKACRGHILPKAGEYAWGTAVVHNVSYNIINEGAFNELITNPAQNGGNARWSGTGSGFRPLRCGIFAASAITKTREETGGSYYGVMELSGNILERCVTVGNPRGRQFTGIHGNGLISPSGDGNSLFWPLTNSNGFGYRGGSYTLFASFAGSLKVSARYTVIDFSDNRDPFAGIRAARTAE